MIQIHEHSGPGPVRKRSLLPMLSLLLFLSQPALGQVEIGFTEDLDFDRPESWALKYFASATLLTGLGAPEETTAGTVTIGMEGGWIPRLSVEERTVGFNGAKTEDLNKTEIFGRPRLTLGLPHDFSLTLSYLPPIEVSGAKPELFSLAIGRPLLLRDSWRLGLRVLAQTGTIEGDFTCGADAVAAGSDPAINPFGCEAVSEDEMTVEYWGIELSTSFDLGSSGRWQGHAGVMLANLDLEFQVNALYSGLLDRTLERTDGTTYAGTLGLTYQPGGPWTWVGEAFYTPLDVVRRPGAPTENDPLFNLRALLTYRIR